MELANITVSQADDFQVPAFEAYAQARKAVGKALALDPSRAGKEAVADIKLSNEFRRLRGDPRYQALLEKMKLPT